MSRADTREGHLRLFISLPIPESARALLYDQLADWRSFPHIRWAKQEQLHCTLKFLGDVDVALLPQLADTIATLAAGFAPFSLSFSEAEIFKRHRPPLPFVVRVRDDAALARFQRALERAMGQLGFEEESRPFTPHVTLGRITERAAFPPFPAFVASFTAEYVLLMSSELRAEGARHHERGRWRLESTTDLMRQRAAKGQR